VALEFLLTLACSVPALFTFTLNSENNLVPSQTLPMAGNVLDVLADIPRKQARALNRIIVSVDTIHRPGSTTECRGSTEERLERLQIFEIQDGKLMEVKDFMFAEAEEHEGSVSLNGAEGRLTNLLYNLENLRKREEDNKEE
jgi:tRNA (guanine-N(7)-)-methyltransferase subunit TRM82